MHESLSSTLITEQTQCHNMLCNAMLCYAGPCGSKKWKWICVISKNYSTFVALNNTYCTARHRTVYSQKSYLFEYSIQGMKHEI